MRVAQILKAKGHKVVTTRLDTTIAELVRTLTLERIGAAVVTGDEGTVVGIISERDIVHGLSEHGADLLNMRVGELMTPTVVTCRPEQSLEDIMREMTSSRIRHLPVLQDGEMVGIISIGDVVKNRLEELEKESGALRDYITRS
ncbi:MAG: CBS domain-containing protein [Alphaproteobacteria bacterium]